MDPPRGTRTRRLAAAVALLAGCITSAGALVVFASHWRQLPQWTRSSFVSRAALLGAVGAWQFALPWLLAALVTIRGDPRGRLLTSRGWAGAVVSLTLLSLAAFRADAWIIALAQLPAELCFVAAWRLAPGGLAPLVTSWEPTAPLEVSPEAQRQRGETLLWISASVLTAARALIGAATAASSLKSGPQNHSWELLGLVGSTMLSCALFWLPAGLLQLKHRMASLIAGVYAVLAVPILIVLVPASVVMVVLSARDFGRDPAAPFVGPAAILACAGVVCQRVGGLKVWRTRPRDT